MGTVYYNSANELATVSTVFSVEGTPTDPGTVTLVVTDPDGQATSYTWAGGTVVRDSAGVFHKDVPCASTTSGVWTAVWIGDTTASDVDVVTWTTFGTDLAKLYCTPNELKSRKGIQQSDQLDDLEIMAACMAATAGIELDCDRVFTRAAGVRTFAATDTETLDRIDLVSVTTLKTDPAGDATFGVTWSASDYQLMDHDALWKPGGPWAYTSIDAIGSPAFPIRSGSGRIDRVQITGVFGWPQVPANVKMAAAVIAGDLLKLAGMSFGVAGYAEYGAVRARANPIADRLLFPYRRSPLTGA